MCGVLDVVKEKEIAEIRSNLRVRLHSSSETPLQTALKDKNIDQKGKGNVHRTQPPTHPSKVSRRPQTKTRRGHKGGERRGTIFNNWILTFI
jgi:hypothetical protein